MLQFITKYQTGGLIDVNAMRADLRQDERYYKDGAYTIAGRRHLAAISEIEANQNSGLTYVVNDTDQSFKIVDDKGKDVHNNAGRGVGQSEFVGPFYGTLGNKRISKKSVSELMSAANKYRIVPTSELAPREESEPVETGEVEGLEPTTEPVVPEEEKEGTPKPTEKEAEPTSEFDYVDRFTGMMMPRGSNAGMHGAMSPGFSGIGRGGTGTVDGIQPTQAQPTDQKSSATLPVALPDTWKDYGELVNKNVKGLMTALYNPSVGNAGGYKSMVSGGDAVFQTKISDIEEAIRLKRQEKPIATDLVIGVPTKGGRGVTEKKASQSSLEELQAALEKAKQEKAGLYRGQAQKNSESAVNYIDAEIKRFSNMKWDNTTERDAVLSYLEYTKDQLVSRYNAVVGNANSANFTALYGSIDNLPGYSPSSLYWSSKQDKIVDYNTWLKEQKDKEGAGFRDYNNVVSGQKKQEQERKVNTSWNNYNPVTEHYKKGGKLMGHYVQKAQFGATLDWKTLVNSMASNASNTALVPVEGGYTPTNLTWEYGQPLPTLPENYGQKSNAPAVQPSNTLAPKMILPSSSTGNWGDYRGASPEKKAKDAEIQAKDEAAAAKIVTGTVMTEGNVGEMGPGQETVGGDQRVLGTDGLYRQDDSGGEKKWQYGSVLSTTGVNVGNMQIQYGDIANLYFALKAKNKKIDEIPVLQEKFTPAGSRSVRAAEDMDAEMIHASENEIAKMRKQYNGSDPIMDLISGHIAREQRGNATQELLTKRAAIRMQERDRVDEQMEQKRQQEAADNLRLTEVENKNNERRLQGKALTAQERARVQSEWWANANSIVQNIQTRNNAQAQVDQQYETVLRVLDHQNKVSSVQSKVASLNKLRGNLEVARYDAVGDPEAIQQIDQRIAEIDAQIAEQSEALTALSGTPEDARKEAAQVKRGQGFFRSFHNGGKLISR